MTAAPVPTPDPKAARAAARDARQLRWMRRAVDRYPWQQMVVPVAYAILVGLLYRRWWEGVPLAALVFAIGVWSWRPDGPGRKRLAARYLGFRANRVREPRSRAEVVTLAALVVWVVITLVVVGFFANEWAHTETACVTPDGYNYADARWGWTPPGLTCAPVADLGGHIVPGSEPSPWRWVAIAVPIVGLGAVIALARRARAERAAQGRRRDFNLAPGVHGERRVIDFFEERRRDSPVVDVGYLWLDHARSAWRVRWIRHTGELVAFRLEWQPPTSPMTWTGATPWPTVTATTVLIVETEESRLWQRLAGYEQHVRAPDGWEWLRSRLRGTAAGT